MEILITGGTGFLGQALCKRYIANHNITVLSRNPQKVKQLLGPKVTSISDVREILKNQHLDIIINLAGEPIFDKRWSMYQKRLLVDSRVKTTDDIIKRIDSFIEKPALLINASAVGYYGDQGDQLVTESTEPHEDFAHHLCEAWEHQAQHAENFGIRVCLLRLPPVLGSGGFLQKMLPAFKLGLGGKMGSGTQWMPWIHLKDLLRIFDFLIMHPELSGPFNATSPAPVTNATFTQTLAAVLHRPAVFTLPEWFIKTIFGERSILLLNSQRVIPMRLQEAGFEFEFDDLKSALEDVLKT